MSDPRRDLERAMTVWEGEGGASHPLPTQGRGEEHAAGPTGWDQKDLTILLNGSAMAPAALPGFATPRIHEHLIRAAHRGWKAVGPIDVLALWRLGRGQCSEHVRLWSEEHTSSLQSVTIKVRQRLSADDAATSARSAGPPGGSHAR